MQSHPRASCTGVVDCSCCSCPGDIYRVVRRILYSQEPKINRSNIYAPDTAVSHGWYYIMVQGSRTKFQAARRHSAAVGNSTTGECGCGGVLRRTPKTEGAVRFMKVPTNCCCVAVHHAHTHHPLIHIILDGRAVTTKKSGKKIETFQTAPCTPHTRLLLHLGPGLDRNAVDVLPASRPSGALVLDEDVRSSHDHELGNKRKKAKSNRGAEKTAGPAV